MKPLYVDGLETRVEYDKPALRIERPDKAVRWFPLRTVSQVVSASRVHWETEALLACAELGIPVSFLDSEGALLARVTGRSSKRAEFGQRFSDFLQRPDWEEHYEVWLTGMERMAARSVIRRAGLGFGLEPSNRALRQMFREAAESMAALAAFERIGGEVHGLLVALTTRQLADSGFGAEFEGVPGFDLAVDLAGIVFWDFQLERMAWLEDRLRDNRDDLPGREEIVAFFEARRLRSEKLVTGLIHRLYRWLLGVY